VGKEILMDLLQNFAQLRRKKGNDYFVEFRFTKWCMGGRPKTELLYRNHALMKLRRDAKALLKKNPKADPPTEEYMQEMAATIAKKEFGENEARKTVEETVEAVIQDGHCGFDVNIDGPYIADRNIYALMREMFSAPGIQSSNRGMKQKRQHLMSILACDELGDPYEGSRSQEINFFRPGEDGYLEGVDDYFDEPGHPIGKDGPRPILKRHDYIENGHIRFILRVPANLPQSESKKMIRDAQVEEAFMFSENNGLGAGRSIQYGKFEVVCLTRLTDNPWTEGGRALKTTPFPPRVAAAAAEKAALKAAS
jgi:hypothetical protein